MHTMPASNNQPPAWAMRTKSDEEALRLGYYWDAAHFERLERFLMAYYKPKYTKRFELMPWQAEYLKCFYNWRAPDGSRRFREGRIHIPKKNGKTLLFSGVTMYELAGTGEPDALVASASTSESNTGQVMEHLIKTIEASKKLSAAADIKESTFRIDIPKFSATYLGLSRDPGNAEGRNLSALLMDEMHAWESRRLYDALRYAHIARANGFNLSISTAGADTEHFYYAIYEHAKSVQESKIIDVSICPLIYECPLGMEDTDEGAILANPSLGLIPGFTLEALRAQRAAAKLLASDWAAFRRYRLNQFVSLATSPWLSVGRWDDCRRPMSDAELAGKKCFVGVDLSQRIDPSSVAIIWYLGDRRYYVRSQSWVCEAGVRQREQSNLPRYAAHNASGALQFTLGDCVDETAIAAYIDALCKKWKPLALCFDQYNFITLAKSLEAKGYKVHYLPQSPRAWNDHARAWERAITEGRIGHDGNSFLRAAVENVRAEEDNWRNLKPARKKSVDKIDPVIAAMMGYAAARACESDTPAAAPNVRIM